MGLSYFLNDLLESEKKMTECDFREAECDFREAEYPDSWGGWHYDDDAGKLYCESCAEKSGITWVDASEME